MARPHRVRSPAAHPSQTPAAQAMLAARAAEVIVGESVADTWERIVRAALAGRSRAAAAALLGVDVRTVQRWRAHLDAHGGAPVGAWSREAEGAGSRGGTSSATRRAERRASVNRHHA